jgi:phage FluMu gp28-like protein
MTYADAYDSVRKVTLTDARLDVWVSSRDERQAQLYLEDCLRWAQILDRQVMSAGYQVLQKTGKESVSALQFASGRRIYSLSSNPNALAGKRGHVKIDEFALHLEQRLLYQVAKPVTTWGGQLCIISTHRGEESLFARLIREIREGGNPMGWSLHTVPLQTAISQGLVERINQKNGRSETREEFAARIRRECVDEEQWLQEYCCVPAGESAAFLTWAVIEPCLASECLRGREHILASPNPFYVGVDVARKKDLCVIDVGEKIGDVIWDRMRIELQDRPFSEIEAELHGLLRMRQVKRACIDSTGMGIQVAERAAQRFEWKVQPITFTAATKEELACGMRMDFQNRHLRIAPDDALIADLRALRKHTGASGHAKYQGQSEDSHCDRFWAKALRQHAARHRILAGASVG